jgi:RNA polymerase sigma-70 factor (ECF subfamily)
VDDFDEFFFDNYTRVVRSLILAGGAPGDAEDAAQDAFAKAMQRWRSVSVMDRPATWVYVVAIRQMRRSLQRGARAVHEVPTPTPDAPDHADAVVASEVIERSLSLLPPRQRLAVVLRFHADLTVPEVSRVMRCSEGTVKSTLHAALEHLRIDLGDRGLEGAHDGS